MNEKLTTIAVVMVTPESTLNPARAGSIFDNSSSSVQL